MTNKRTRFAIYVVLSLKALMWYDAPMESAATVAAAPDAAPTDTKLAVKSSEGAREYQGPRFEIDRRLTSLFYWRCA